MKRRIPNFQTIRSEGGTQVLAARRLRVEFGKTTYTATFPTMGRVARASHPGAMGEAAPSQRDRKEHSEVPSRMTSRMICAHEMDRMDRIH